MSRAVENGDYVLASKYFDGDPQDHWCVGFYKESYMHCGFELRHIVVNGDGLSFRHNGFRRVARISAKRGDWMVRNFGSIELSSRSVWHFARCKMSELT